MTALDDHIANLNRLRWQVEMLRAEAERDVRRAKFRFVHTLRRTRAEHPLVAKLAWWVWRYWMKRGWDGRKIN